MHLISFFTFFFAASAAAQRACSGNIPPATGEPVVAKGYTARILANGLTRPRGLLFDAEGNLLVVESGKGITALKLKDDGGTCVSVVQRQTVVADSSLNHGIQLSTDGKTLFASNSDKVFSWGYDAKTAKTTSQPHTWVTGMVNTDHTTRTLLISKKAKGTLLVSRGSASNIDNLARNINSGHSQIRAFDVSGAPKTYQYTQGKLIGWGLRNSVGMDEDPVTGAVYSNENGSDDMRRDGKDIHENSPGEEINFHGYLNGTKYAGQGGNYGYPNCAAAWTIHEMPRNSNLKVGRQFYLGSPTASLNDTSCEKEYIAPRLTLPSHWAPIDMKFNSKGTVAYMTSRGSWNKRSPDGYKLFAISFANGDPVHSPASTTAAIPILSNARLSACPTGCFRPTGLAFDSKGRLYMASDRSREIFVLGRTDGSSVDSVTLETPSGFRRLQKVL